MSIICLQQLLPMAQALPVSAFKDREQRAAAQVYIHSGTQQNLALMTTSVDM